MLRHEIAIGKLNVDIFSVVNNQLLLGCGDFSQGDFNMMTISWGLMGTVWGRPMVQVLVRPQRHTWTFMEKAADFTLAWFSPEYSSILNLCGSRSGRDVDKLAASGLQAEASRVVASPSWAQAGLILECRIVYRDRLEPGNFMASYIAPHYQNDWHYLYYGEVVAASAVSDSWPPRT